MGDDTWAEGAGVAALDFLSRSNIEVSAHYSNP
jgi:hypothetical protein